MGDLVYHVNTYYSFCFHQKQVSLATASCDQPMDQCNPYQVLHCFLLPSLAGTTSLSIIGQHFKALVRNYYHLGRMGLIVRQIKEACAYLYHLCLQHCKKNCWQGSNLTSCSNQLADDFQTLIKQGCLLKQFFCFECMLTELFHLGEKLLDSGCQLLSQRSFARLNCLLFEPWAVHRLLGYCQLRQIIFFQHYTPSPSILFSS